MRWPARWWPRRPARRAVRRGSGWTVRPPAPVERLDLAVTATSTLARVGADIGGRSDELVDPAAGAVVRGDGADAAPLRRHRPAAPGPGRCQRLPLLRTGRVVAPAGDPAAA